MKGSARPGKIMNRPRLLFSGLVIAALIAGGAWWWRDVAARTAWSQSIASIPDLSALPAEFGERVTALTAQARARFGDVSALGELSRLYDASGFQREAALAYVGLERFEPLNARWPHLLAHTLAGMGRLDEAVPRWRRATELAPEYVPAHVLHGDALLKINQPEAAGAAYAAALAFAPGHAHALLGQARVEMQLGRWTAARARLQEAAAAQPDFGVAWNLLATVYQRLGNDGGAAAAQARADGSRRFREMSDPWRDELLHECFDIYRLRVAASAALASGDPAGAVPWLERAVRLAPDSAAVHRDLGNVFMEQHDTARARREFERAVALAPADDSAHVLLIGCLAASGDIEGAREAAEAAVQACPNAAGLWFTLGRHRLATEQMTDALAAFDTARRLRPEAPEAYYEIAGIHFREGRENEGVAMLESALTQVSERAGTLLALAQRAIETGDAPAATAWLQQAQARGPAAGEGLPRLVGLYQQRFGRMPW